MQIGKYQIPVYFILSFVLLAGVIALKVSMRGPEKKLPASSSVVEKLPKTQNMEPSDEVTAIHQKIVTENTPASSITTRRHQEKHQNGNLAVNGMLEGEERIGTWQRWDEKGNLLSEDTYSENETRRKLVDYYPNGKKKVSGEYFRGLKNGEWEAWDEAGNSRGKLFYRDGKIAKISVANSNNNP